LIKILVVGLIIALVSVNIAYADIYSDNGLTYQYMVTLKNGTSLTCYEEITTGMLFGCNQNKVFKLE
jgi:fibronectin type 3 domain-containing protein